DIDRLVEQQCRVGGVSISIAVQVDEQSCLRTARYPTCRRPLDRDRVEGEWEASTGWCEAVEPQRCVSCRAVTEAHRILVRPIVQNEADRIERSGHRDSANMVADATLGTL